MCWRSVGRACDLYAGIYRILGICLSCIFISFTGILLLYTQVFGSYALLLCLLRTVSYLLYRRTLGFNIGYGLRCFFHGVLRGRAGCRGFLRGSIRCLYSRIGQSLGIGYLGIGLVFRGGNLRHCIALCLCYLGSGVLRGFRGGALGFHTSGIGFRSCRNSSFCGSHSICRCGAHRGKTVVKVFLRPFITFATGNIIGRHNGKRKCHLHSGGIKLSVATDENERSLVYKVHVLSIGIVHIFKLQPHLYLQSPYP